MYHPSGLSLVTSPTAPNDESPWIRNSGLTASECGNGFYYGQVSVEFHCGSQSDEWNLQTSTGDCLHRRLAVGGGWGGPVPSVPESYR